VTPPPDDENRGPLPGQHECGCKWRRDSVGKRIIVYSTNDNGERTETVRMS
jgi:hypothetical protein